jgi:sensor histidine kinase regulating citrate/malate metabolism
MYSTKDKPQSLGLGLWWTKLYLEQLGGVIKVQSKEGEGSRFSIFLPQATSK